MPRTAPQTKTKAKAKSAQTRAESPNLQRLQKVIASAGITSRRKAEELIAEGRVVVNGKTVTEQGAKVDPLRDSVLVDGRKITGRPAPMCEYVLLNKPKGFISAVSDPLNRPVVVDLVKGVRGRLYPVGRLDYDAEGVLLLTNDGDLSNHLIHPKFGVQKTYLVKVKDAPSQEAISRLERGVYLEDGKTLPAKAHFIRRTAENSWIELTVREGRNRLVKRMCMAIGHPVAKLKRTEFAGIKLGLLKPGEYRRLTPQEVVALKSLYSKESSSGNAAQG